MQHISPNFGTCSYNLVRASLHMPPKVLNYIEYMTAYNPRVRKFYEASDSVDTISKGDQIYVYEVELRAAFAEEDSSASPAIALPSTNPVLALPGPSNENSWSSVRRSVLSG